MESFRARLVRSTSEQGIPKSLAPKGYNVGGMVYVNALARTILQQGRAPEWWPVDRPLRLVITEGDPDFLTWSTRGGDADETAPAVMGVVSGSWTETIADRVPSGTQVGIRTHHDTSGKKYAQQIYETLKNRCHVLRAARKEGTIHD